MEKIPTLAYNRYNVGYSYNLRLNYYNKVTENENMVNGEQWVGVNAGDLPTPVFNLESELWTMLYHVTKSKRYLFHRRRFRIMTQNKIDEITPEMEKNCN